MGKQNKQVLSKSVIRRIGCKGEDCLKHLTYTKVPRGKIAKNGVTWEYSARCPSCPKVIIFSEPMMKSIRRVIQDIEVGTVTNTFDTMFTKQ
jgi:hypothetical protein